jgi:O-antigen/teichoic acid export membrane protein
VPADDPDASSARSSGSPSDDARDEGTSHEALLLRGKDRTRRAVLTSASSLVAHATGLATSLVSVPLTLHYLGKERYGLWGSISALLMWAALADFGLGRGIVNHLSEAFARDDRDAAGRYVSTGFFWLLVIAAGMALLFYPLLPLIPWDWLFNVRAEDVREETRGAVAAVIAVFLVNFPLSVVGPIYAAYQRSYIANLFRIVGNVASLGVLIAATQLKLRLPWLVVAMGGVPLTMSVVNLAFITRDMPWLAPRLRNVGRNTLFDLASVSTPLFLFQVGALLINELQTLVVARRAGLMMVADYTVFLKVYSVPVLVLGMIDGPLIPSFREALTRRDVGWLRQTFWKAQWIKLAVCAVATVYYVGFGNFATGLLSEKTVQFDSKVWLAATALTVVGTWNGSFNDLLISTNRLWLLVRFILANGVVTATLTYLAAERYGVLGIVTATTVYSLIVTTWVFPWVCWKHISPSATTAELLAAADQVVPSPTAPRGR